MRQLGAIISLLLNLRFDKIGSLFEEDGKYRVGDCLSPALIWHERDSWEDEISRGPYQHAHEYLESLVSAFLLHIKELPLEKHVFFVPIPEAREYKTYSSYRYAVDRWNDFVTIGSKIDSSKNRLDYCTAGYFLRKMIHVISQQFSGTLGDLDGYPLCHPDLSSSNVFVDEDFTITCIIDGEFCSTVPTSALLMTPSLPHPKDEIDTTLADAFRVGFSHDFGRKEGIDLDPALWDSTRRTWLFSRLVTLDGLQDYRYFNELYTSVYRSDNIPKLFKRVQKEQEFVDVAAELAKGDLSAGEISMAEKEYFRYSDSESEDLARRLSQLASLSDEFVADKNLWLRVEAQKRGKAHQNRARE